MSRVSVYCLRIISITKEDKQSYKWAEVQMATTHLKRFGKSCSKKRSVDQLFVVFAKIREKALCSSPWKITHS